MLLKDIEKGAVSSTAPFFVDFFVFYCWQVSL
jgi:hypothetical protein